MMKRFALLGGIFAVILVGCGEKKVTIQEWEQYQNQFFKVSFIYPKNWYVVTEPNRVLVYSSIEAADKFFTHDPRKEDGVQIIVASDMDDSTYNLDKYVNNFYNDQNDAGFTMKPIEDATLEGLPAKKVEFSGAYDQETKISSIRIVTFKDSTIYYVQYSAFNKMYEPYKFVFDSVVNSLSLPKKIVAKKGIDPAIPFTETEKYSCEYFELEYPANFGINDLPRKGNVQHYIQIIGRLEGYRKDCDIQIDVRPAQKLSVEKVVEQNLKNYRVLSRGETKISGEKAIYLNYSPLKGIESRVYFVVKNDRIYRITLNYFAPMKKDFLPAFEKVVASIRLK